MSLLKSQVLAQALRDAASSLPTRDQITEHSVVRSPTLSPAWRRNSKKSTALLAATPNSLEIREEENYWRGIKSYTTAGSNNC